ncbi:hypothetical protein EVA_19142 [gut metagenome]|uniref:Uncharacterized protein n=1 Tax=gut metagenome TaxID=749906 RepID=J9FCY1_9ZZZZ
MKDADLSPFHALVCFYFFRSLQAVCGILTMCTVRAVRSKLSVYSVISEYSVVTLS